MFTFDQERMSDSQDITALLDIVFGPSREEKASYALRRGVEPIDALSLVARHDGGIAATVRFWPIVVRDLITNTQSETLLLGPLAVAPEVQGHGVGSSLVEYSLNKAHSHGYHRVLLVGDRNYYGKFGFVPVLPSFITLPGGKDARRLLVRQSARLTSLPPVGTLLPWQPQGTPVSVGGRRAVPAFAM